MSQNSKIEWTETTWNPVLGCSKISPGCKNCYAIRQVHRMAGNPNPKIRAANEGLTVIQNGAPNWTGEVRLIEDRLEQPLHWRKPRRIFVNSLSDLFHGDLASEDINQVLAVMALCSNHTFQVLTKRQLRMLKHLTDDDMQASVWMAEDALMQRLFGAATMGTPWPLPNVWFGVSVEDQATADERIPLLVRTPAAVRWVSAEPLLGPLDIRRFIEPHWTPGAGADPPPWISWVVVGGESGPGARPCNPQWLRDVRDQCKAANVPYFCKQLGSVIVGDPEEFPSAIHDTGDGHRTFRLRDKKGGDIGEFPRDLQIREFPTMSEPLVAAAPEMRCLVCDGTGSVCGWCCLASSQCHCDDEPMMMPCKLKLCAGKGVVPK